MTEGQPFIDLAWVLDNLDQLARRVGEHLLVTSIAVVIGFVLSFGLALLIRRYPRLYAPGPRGERDPVRDPEHRALRPVHSRSPVFRL